MKTLTEFNSIKAFLLSQNLQPTLALVSLSDGAWNDLVNLAHEWNTNNEAKIAEEAEREAALSNEERMLEQKRAERRIDEEQQEILFYSSGHSPKKRSER